jgi:hypothetical protein
MPHKQCRQAYQPTQRKQAKSLPPVDAERAKIQYAFSRFDKRPWHDSAYRPVVFNDVADHLRSFERITWRELLTRNPKHDHPVKIERLTAEAQQRLRELKFDDVDELWRLRFSGQRRLWGLRSGPVLYILWWDPQHRICPSELRGT